MLATLRCQYFSVVYACVYVGVCVCVPGLEKVMLPWLIFRSPRPSVDPVPALPHVGTESLGGICAPWPRMIDDAYSDILCRRVLNCTILF